MAKFRFYQEFEVTRKLREYYEIEADSLEEAREMANEVCDLEDLGEAEFDEVEEIFPELDRNFLKGTITMYDSEGEEIN